MVFGMKIQARGRARQYIMCRHIITHRAVQVKANICWGFIISCRKKVQQVYMNGEQHNFNIYTTGSRNLHTLKPECV